MKKIITTVFCTALALCSGLTVYATENLDRDDIEAEIWEDMWNGKGDNGLDFPEASYKHHTSIIFLTSGLTRTTVQKIMTGLKSESFNMNTRTTTVV